MAVKSLKELKSLATKADKLSTKEIDGFLKQLKRFLDTALEEVVGEMMDGNSDPALALGGLLDAIKKKGLKGELAELATIYKGELKKVQAQYKDVGISSTYRAINTDTLNALIKFKVEDIQNKSLEVIGELRPKILEQVIMGQAIDLTPLKAIVASRLFNQVKTELRTATLTFNRTVTVSRAKELGYEKWSYVGPDDDVTRPFCQDLLSRDPAIYTTEEIEEMDNDQDLDVFTSCGGWNCRHRWVPISDELEAELRAEAEANKEAEEEGTEDDS
jgi:hypothetical protein